MKTTNLASLTLIAALIMGGLIFNSCSKEEMGGQTTARNNHAQMTPGDQAVFNSIVNFKKKIDYIKENPEYKSGEEMSVDSAIWYLDASFNLTYGFINDSFSAFKTDTFSLAISKTGDMIDLDQVVAAFYEMKDKALIIYNATEGFEKQLYVTHMEITSNAADEVVMKTTATIGAKTDGTPPGLSQWGPFVEGDDWMYGEMLGDCYGNWEDEKDAATEIWNATNIYRSKYIQDEGPGWSAYYTEPSAVAVVTVYSTPQIKELLVNPNDDVIDNDRDYLLLYQVKDEPNNLFIHTCIPWEEMNFYYRGAHDVIYDIVQDNYDVFGVHASLTFKNCDFIEGKHVGGPDEDPDLVYHVVHALYKTRHIIGEIPDPTPINE